MRSLGPLLLACFAGALLAGGCNRNIEEYDPQERPEQPDLSKIFPSGAAVAQANEGATPGMLPEAGRRRGAPPVAAASEAGAPIRGTIAVAPDLEGRVPANAVLFLVARSVSGGPPVAVQRFASPRFPVTFALGPDDRMLEAIPFAGPMALSARLDQDGNATSRSPGDLQGAAPAPVEPGAKGVEILLDQAL